MRRTAASRSRRAPCRGSGGRSLLRVSRRDDPSRSRQRPANLFVARTFSKAYGLAGLRIGILAGDAAQMAMVRRVASPYNVNAVALAVLPEALRDQEYVEHYVSEVQRGRELLQQELRALGLRYWPSRANFVLVRVGPAYAEFIQALRTRGILVRDRNTDPAMRWLRAPDRRISRTYADSDRRPARSGRETQGAS